LVDADAPGGIHGKVSVAMQNGGKQLISSLAGVLEATGGACFPWDKTGLQFGTIQIIALSTS
jgi:hypothetical protein